MKHCGPIISDKRLRVTRRGNARDPQRFGVVGMATARPRPRHNWEPDPESLGLARGADDDRVAAEVEVVVLSRRNDCRRDSAAGREQERRESAAAEAVHLRLLEAG